MCSHMPTLLLTRDALNQFRARTDILVTGCIDVNNLFVFLSCLQSWTTILAPGWSPARAILAAISVGRWMERRSSEVISINMCAQYLSWTYPHSEDGVLMEKECWRRMDLVDAVTCRLERT